MPSHTVVFTASKRLRARDALRIMRYGLEPFLDFYDPIRFPITVRNFF